jgi:phosphoribosylanthranilate isomerase
MVDVSSGVEVSPGIKDKELMARFVREARCDTDRISQ